MQTSIAEKGVIHIRYRCHVCPHGCELTDNMMEGMTPRIHNHSCHHFPSLTTAWARIA